MVAGTVFVAGTRGITDFAASGDDWLTGPEPKLFTSNAVTA
jgi:hypothetical protein